MLRRVAAMIVLVLGLTSWAWAWGEIPFPLSMAEGEWYIADANVVVEIYNECEFRDYSRVYVGFKDPATKDLISAQTVTFFHKEHDLTIYLTNRKGERVPISFQYDQASRRFRVVVRGSAYRLDFINEPKKGQR